MQWRQNTIHTLGAVLVVASLASCATGYQANGITGGYTEKKITDSAYVVSFGGNGFATKDRVYYFWMYRCAELTWKRVTRCFRSASINRLGSIRRQVPFGRPCITRGMVLRSSKPAAFPSSYPVAERPRIGPSRARC